MPVSLFCPRLDRPRPTGASRRASTPLLHEPAADYLKSLSGDLEHVALASHTDEAVSSVNPSFKFTGLPARG